MLARQKLGTHKLAVKAFKEANSVSVSITIDITQTIEIKTGGLLFDIVQNIQQDKTIGTGGLSFCPLSTSPLVECLPPANAPEWAMVPSFLFDIVQYIEPITPVVPDKVWQFRGSNAVDGNGFNLGMTIDGKKMDCKLFDSIRIERISGSATLCDFHLRGDVGEVDLYQYHGQRVELFLYNDEKRVRMFTGVVGVPLFDILGRVSALSATDSRKILNSRLSPEFVASIGKHSELLFKDDVYDIHKDIENRLSTIPAALDYDLDQHPMLTPWMPKESADYNISDCVIYKRELSLKLADTSNIINKATVNFHYRYDRLLQRDTKYKFDFDVSVCHYGQFQMPPTVESIVSATNASGWHVGNMKTTGLHPSGVYNCFGSPLMWSTGSVEYNKIPLRDPNGVAILDENGNPKYTAERSSAVDYTNMYAQTATWDASRRWKQQVEELYSVTLINQWSIARHGEQASESHYTAENKLDDNKWDKWQDYNPLHNPDAEFTKRVLASSKDVYWNTDDNMASKYRDAFVTAVSIEYTKMLKSHYDNELTFSAKMLPEINLSHTVGLNGRYAKGNGKVTRINHTFDISKRVATTQLTLNFFQNARGEGISIITAPGRMVVNDDFEPSYPINLTKVLIEEDDIVANSEAEVDELIASGVPPYRIFRLYDEFGFILQHHYRDFKRNPIYKAMRFQIKTEAVQEKLTNADENTANLLQPVGIPNNELRVFNVNPR